MTSFFSRKGSANMWWIIIGAVIALVVMIVLMVMFTGKSNKLEVGLLDCGSKGGKCYATVDACTTAKGSATSAFECSQVEQNKGNRVCCFGVK